MLHKYIFFSISIVLRAECFLLHLTESKLKPWEVRSVLVHRQWDSEQGLEFTFVWIQGHALPVSELPMEAILKMAFLKEEAAW